MFRYHRVWLNEPTSQVAEVIGVVKVPDIHMIRQLHERQGWSARRIAREMHYSRTCIPR